MLTLCNVPLLHLPHDSGSGEGQNKDGRSSFEEDPRGIVKQKIFNQPDDQKTTNLTINDQRPLINDF